MRKKFYEEKNDKNKNIALIPTELDSTPIPQALPRAVTILWFLISGEWHWYSPSIALNLQFMFDEQKAGLLSASYFRMKQVKR